MKLLHWLLLLSILLSSGCGGGAPQAPAVSDLQLVPKAAGALDVSFGYRDQDGDIATLTMTLYDGSGNQLEKWTRTTSKIAGSTAGSIGVTIDFSTLAAGEYSLEMYVTDGQRFNSNSLSKSFIATGGAGRAVTYQNPTPYLLLGDTAIGDLNGDGRNDVVAIQGANNTGELLVYYQNASGTLEPALVKELDIETRGVVIADINSDGRADLVIAGVANSYVGWRGRVIVMRQDPATGELLPPQSYTVSSSSVDGVAVGDLNGDGRNDIAVMAPDTAVSPPAPAGGVSFFYQNSSGTLDPEVSYDSLNAPFGGQIHIADMNNDGMNDIVVQSGLKELAVIRQTAPGVFSATPERYSVQTSYWPYFNGFALGDVNGDGLTDVVTVDPGNNGYINIFLQNGHGTLNAPALVVADVPFGVKIADITRDGLNDIVYDFSGGVVVLPQQADHTFGPGVSYSYPSLTTGGSPVEQALSIGDVTGDGKLDVVVTWLNEGLYVLPYATHLTAK